MCVCVSVNPSNIRKYYEKLHLISLIKYETYCQIDNDINCSVKQNGVGWHVRPNYVIACVYIVHKYK